MKLAEQHYIKAKEWKAASDMYREANMWDEALRVAKSYGDLDGMCVCACVCDVCVCLFDVCVRVYVCECVRFFFFFFFLFCFVWYVYYVCMYVSIISVIT